jgi:hypothetical protein
MARARLVGDRAPDRVRVRALLRLDRGIRHLLLLPLAVLL